MLIDVESPLGMFWSTARLGNQEDPLVNSWKVHDAEDPTCFRLTYYQNSNTSERTEKSVSKTRNKSIRAIMNRAHQTLSRHHFPLPLYKG